MKPMTCKQVQATLVDYIESEISVDQRKSVKDHLSECFVCTEEYNGLRDMLNNARQDQTIPDPGETFWDTLPGRVLAEVNAQKSTANATSQVVDINKHKKPAKAQNINGNYTSTSNTFWHTWGMKTLPIAATVLIAVSALLLLPARNDINFNSLSYQSTIHSEQGLSVLANRFIPIREMSARLGFNDQTRQANAFVIGTLYAESLALLGSGNNVEGAKHLEMLIEDLRVMGVDNKMVAVVTDVKEDITMDPQTRVPLRQFGELQNDLETYMNKHSDRDGQNLVMFRMGTWTVDIGLAAAANNKNLLKQSDKLSYFMCEMDRFEAPIGVINTLNNMDQIVSQDTIADRDASNLFQMVQKLRGLLG